MSKLIYGFYSKESADKYGYVVHLSINKIPVPITRVSFKDAKPAPGEIMIPLPSNSHLTTSPLESTNNSPNPSLDWYDDCY